MVSKKQKAYNDFKDMQGKENNKKVAIGDIIYPLYNGTINSKNPRWDIVLMIDGKERPIILLSFYDSHTELILRKLKSVGVLKPKTLKDLNK